MTLYLKNPGHNKVEDDNYYMEDDPRNGFIKCNMPGQFDYLTEKIDLCTTRVFGRKLNIIAVSLRSLDAVDRALNDLFLRHPKLELTVNRARRQEDVNTRIFCAL